MNSFMAALGFLTVIPTGSYSHAGEDDLKEGVVYFSIIGLIIGGLVIVLTSLLPSGFSPLLTSAIIVLLLIAASGGLHMDGLADTMDGFFSARPRDKMLEIMRDSRIGTMGVIGIVFIILLKTAALASVHASVRLEAVILMPLAGRCSLLIEMYALEYAREEGGLASVFGADRKALLSASIKGAILLLAVGAVIAGVTGVIAGLVSLIITALMCVYVKSKLGGYTGDTLGATCEVVELVPALVFAVSGSGVG